MAETCLFCRIVAGELPSTRVHDDDLVIAFHDIAPRAPTHVLIVPRRHIASALELTEADGPLLGRTFAVAAALAREAGIAERGYRLVSNIGEWGGQSVDHLHWHLMGGRSMAWPPGSIRTDRPIARRRAAWVLATVAAAVLLAGCGGGVTLGGLGSVPDAETPRPSAGASAAGALRLLTDALAADGFELAPATRAWQPAQPGSFGDVPRSAFQVRLADPDDGVVLVYEFGTAEAAAAGADDLAAYLSSGPGRINFPGDATFHVGQVGPAVLMTWFAPSAAGDDDAAAMAFDIMASVGTEHEVLR